MSWFQLWTMCWQIAVFVTPMLVACAVFWLKAQFVTKADATTERNRVDGAIAAVTQAAIVESNRVNAALTARKSEGDGRYEAVKDRSADHEGRIKALEQDGARPPTRHQLNNAIATMQGALHAVERGVDGMRGQMETQSADLRRQMETLNSYLHTVIEKHLV